MADCDCEKQRVSFEGTGLWILGYLLFVWLTPAPFDLYIFIIPLFALAGVEAIEGLLRIQNNRVLWGQK